MVASVALHSLDLDPGPIREHGVKLAKKPAGLCWVEEDLVCSHTNGPRLDCCNDLPCSVQLVALVVRHARAQLR
eukprot:1062505-Rhodomonas_salina.1